jgi:predicted O-methyltransferase YrrM
MQFTNDWFTPQIPTWNTIIPQYNPARIIEVGSFEGQSICHLIKLLGNQHDLEIYCIDTWSGGQEHRNENMLDVEKRFDLNVAEQISNVDKKISLTKIKSDSFLGLSHLISLNMNGYFDMIYIDGSHETPDVLSDAILSFKLLRMGGLMIFDDYLWGLGNNAEPLMNPKLGIDSFLNCFQKKMQPHPWLPNYQLYCRKISD